MGARPRSVVLIFAGRREVIEDRLVRGDVQLLPQSRLLLDGLIVAASQNRQKSGVKSCIANVATAVATLNLAMTRSGFFLMLTVDGTARDC